MSDLPPFRHLGDVAAGLVAKAEARLRSLPTRYKGVTYRSRLEARWAVFFDVIGAAAEYEPEGYDLDGIWYLPDFYLRAFDLFVEVKPYDPSTEEIRKCVRLSTFSGKRVLLVIGPPATGRGILFPHYREFPDDGPAPGAVGFALCRKCGAPCIVREELCCYTPLVACRNEIKCHDNIPWVGLGFEEAISAAADARFEQRRRHTEKAT